VQSRAVGLANRGSGQVAPSVLRFLTATGLHAIHAHGRRRGGRERDDSEVVIGVSYDAVSSTRATIVRKESMGITTLHTHEVYDL
jgi:hypothetical protein